VVLLILAASAVTGALPGLANRMNVAAQAVELTTSAAELTTSNDDATTRSPASPPPSSNSRLSPDTKPVVSAKEMARLEWEMAIQNATAASLDDRFAEARYYLVAMAETPVSFWLGSGAGDSVTINIDSGHDRVVRGAHNTIAA